MGKGNKTTTDSSQQSNYNNQGTSTTTLPQNIQDAANQNLSAGMGAAYGWNPTLQQNPAGFTDDQLQAMGIARGEAVGGGGSEPVNQALWGANNAVSYQPGQVTGQTYNPSQMAAAGYNAATLGPATGYTAAQVGPIAAASTQGYNATTIDPNAARGYAAQTGTANQQNRADIQNVGVQNVPQQLPSYLQAFDPSYQTAVINASMNDLDRARQLTQQSNAGQAAQAGAFGDSRLGVMDAQTNDAYLRNVANLSANLRQQGFNTALSSLQQDTGNQLQSQLANQQADIGVSANNAGFQNQFGLANMAAQNAAGQYLAGQQNQFQALNQAAQNEAAQFGAQAANQASMQQAASQAAAQQANAAAINQALQYGAGAQNQFGLANQGALNQAGQFNAQLGFNVGANNQAANNAAGQYNATNLQNAQLANQGAGLQGQNVNLSAANTLGNLGQLQQSMAFNNANNLYGLGSAQQGYNQNVLNTLYGNQQALNNAPLQQVAYGQQVVQGTPYGTSTSTTGTGSGTQTGQSTTTQTQSPWSMLANAAGAGLGAYFSDERAKTDIQPLAKDYTGEAMGDDGSFDNADLRGLRLQQQGTGPAPSVTGGFGWGAAGQAALKSALNAPQMQPGPSPMLGPMQIPALPQAPSALQRGAAFGGPMQGVNPSDARLKTGFKPITGSAMKAVHKLKPISFRWKGTGQPDSGFSAQNVAEALPAAGREMGFGLKGYSLPAVTGLLAEGLKQLDRKVDRQKLGLLS